MMAAGCNHNGIDSSRNFDQGRTAMRRQITDSQLAVAVAAEGVNLPVAGQQNCGTKPG